MKDTAPFILLRLLCITETELGVCSSCQVLQSTRYSRRTILLPARVSHVIYGYDSSDSVVSVPGIIYRAHTCTPLSHSMHTYERQSLCGVLNVIFFKIITVFGELLLLSYYLREKINIHVFYILFICSFFQGTYLYFFYVFSFYIKLKSPLP